jgi:hypothetical protein
MMVCAAAAVVGCARHQTSESTGEVAPATGTESTTVHRDSAMNRTRDDTLNMRHDTTTYRDTTMNRSRDTTMNRDTSTYRDTTMHRDTSMYRDTTMHHDTT